MEEITLDVKVRSEVGGRKIKSIRANDSVPAVLYGGEDDTTLIKVEKKIYEKIMRGHKGENVIFHLNVFDGDKKLSDWPAIVKEEQHDPVLDNLLHIDFKRISLTEEVKVKISIVPKGEAPGVKKDGGSLEHNLWEVDVICLPTNIPTKIDVDVSHLNIGDAIHVKDLVLPEGVRTEHDPESILISVVAPMKEEEESPEEGEAVEPEVTKEKKDKEGSASSEDGTKE